MRRENKLSKPITYQLNATGQHASAIQRLPEAVGKPLASFDSANNLGDLLELKELELRSWPVETNTAAEKLKH